MVTKVKYSIPTPTATYSSDVKPIYQDTLLSELALLREKVARLETEVRQAYFWTKEWQKGESAAERDIKAGRTKRFSSASDAIAYLRS